MAKSTTESGLEQPTAPRTQVTQPPAPAVGPGFCLAFAAVTLAGFAQAANAPAGLVPRDALPLLLLLCFSYVLLGTAGLALVERRRARTAVLTLLLVTAALGVATTLASCGYTAMMLLAVVSASVLHLSFAASIVVTVAAAIAAQVAFGLRDTPFGAFVQARVSFASGMAFVFFFSRIALRERRGRATIERLLHELADANTSLAAQARDAQQLATVHERNRIAREIHDGLGHYMTVVHVQLEAALARIDSEPDLARENLGKAQELNRAGLQEVRRSVGMLRGDNGHTPPLIQALRALAAECSEAGVATSLRVEGTPRRVAESLEFTLYRAAQEALTNARRHAHASRVDLALRFGAQGVELSVCDDGVGSDPVREGFGLLGLRERAALVGGKVSIGSLVSLARTLPTRFEDRAGFAVVLEVPA
jgi:signal transduction histidine kinase